MHDGATSGCTEVRGQEALTLRNPLELVETDELNGSLLILHCIIGSYSLVLHGTLVASRLDTRCKKCHRV